jgi:hypothetical protein
MTCNGGHAIKLGSKPDPRRKTVGLAKGAAEKRGLSKKPRITLAEIGIDKNLANQARKFAALSEDKFDALVGRRALTRQSNANATDFNAWT